MNKKLNLLVTDVGKQFKDKHLSLVTAESCTGGAIAYLFSKHPECSSILERGFICYSNPSKESLLGVDSSTLQTQGAVNKETALQMALGALKNSEAQVSISTTGIAGPDYNDSKEDATGTVWLACVDNFDYRNIQHKNIKGSRTAFIDNVVYEALMMLKEYLDKMK